MLPVESTSPAGPAAPEHRASRAAVPTVSATGTASLFTCQHVRDQQYGTHAALPLRAWVDTVGLLAVSIADCDL